MLENKIKLPTLVDDLYIHCPPDMQGEDNCRNLDCALCWHMSFELEANRQHETLTQELREENKRLRGMMLTAKEQDILDKGWRTISNLENFNEYQCDSAYKPILLKFKQQAKEVSHD